MFVRVVFIKYCTSQLRRSTKQRTIVSLQWTEVASSGCPDCIDATRSGSKLANMQCYVTGLLCTTIGTISEREADAKSYSVDML